MTFASDARAICVRGNSITSFCRFINGLNARRPVGMRKTADELTKKLLMCITPSINSTLGSDAMKELRAPAAQQKYRDAAAGTRDYDAAQKDLDELWRSLFQAGAIKPAASQRSGVRTDSAAVQDDDDDAFFANSVGSTLRKFFNAAELRLHPICRNCLGFGHLMAT